MEYQKREKEREKKLKLYIKGIPNIERYYYLKYFKGKYLKMEVLFLQVRRYERKHSENAIKVQKMQYFKKSGNATNIP